MILSNTNLNLYNTFIVVFETKNLATSGKILNVTRSAVGQKVKELGGQLGVTLFTPHRKGVVPTAEARNLYPVIKDAMDAIIKAEVGLRTLDTESTGHIKMAMSNTGVMMFLRDYMKEFCTTYPKVTFEFFGLENVNLLEKGEIDFIIDAPSLFKGTNIKMTDLFTAKTNFVATKQFLKKHGLGTNITSDELARLPVITLRPSETSEDLGLQVKSYIKTVSLDMTYQMVKAGLGIGFFVKELLDSLDDPDLVEVTVNGVSLPGITVVCGYNKSLSRPAKAFVDGLAKFCQ